MFICWWLLLNIIYCSYLYLIFMSMLRILKHIQIWGVECPLGFLGKGLYFRCCILLSPGDGDLFLVKIQFIFLFLMTRVLHTLECSQLKKIKKKAKISTWTKQWWLSENPNLTPLINFKPSFGNECVWSKYVNIWGRVWRFHPRYGDH